MKILRKRTLLSLAAILMAAFLCFYVVPKQNIAAGKRVSIVRAEKTIPEGMAITSDMVQQVSVGGYNLPSNVLKDKKDVVGKYASAELQPGDYILSTKVTVKASDSYLSSLDGNKQAISIPIKSFAAGLSGKLQSGDIVSLIVGSYGNEKKTFTSPELRYVKLLAATNSQGDDMDTVKSKKTDKDSDSDKYKKIPATLTLLVNSEQAKLLVDYQTQGELYASLVYRGTEENAEKYLDEQDSYFSGTGAQQGETTQAGGSTANGG